MTEIQKTIAQYVLRSAGTCNHLTTHTLLCFVELHRQGVSCVKIAKELGMNSTTIWRIVNREAWRHIE